MKVRVNNATIEVVDGDITKETTDAIVNAANQSLLGGGGVDGAIHRAGGPAILEECKKLGGCDTGDAKMTTGGDLPARFVIHAVGPVYGGRETDAKLLESCYYKSMGLAQEQGLKSISFPAISCGVYGYPVEEAAAIAVRAVADFLREHEGIKLVRFVLFTAEVRERFEAALAALEA